MQVLCLKCQHQMRDSSSSGEELTFNRHQGLRLGSSNFCKIPFHLQLECDSNLIESNIREFERVKLRRSRWKYTLQVVSKTNRSAVSTILFNMSNHMHYFKMCCGKTLCFLKLMIECQEKSYHVKNCHQKIKFSVSSYESAKNEAIPF